MVKKVLLIAPLTTVNWGSKNAGGVDSVCQMLVRHLVNHPSTEFQYRIVAIDPLMNHCFTGEIIQLSGNVELLWVPINKKILGKIPIPSILYHAYKVYQQNLVFKPNVINSHIWSWLIGVPKKSPSIATVHSYKWIARRKVSRFNDWFYIKLLPNVTRLFGDEVVCVGERLKSAVELDVKQRVSVIGNPIDESYFIERKSKIDVGTIKIVTCALLTPRKQVEKIIELTKSMSVKGYDIQLNIIGPASDKKYFALLQQQVKEADLECNVNFLGHLNKNEIIEQYKNSDLGVFLSKEETFGLAPLEMMAAGLPLLSTKVGVLAEHEALFSELGVKFVDASSPQGMLNEAEALIAAPVCPDVDMLKNIFSVASVIEQYENLYRELSK